MVISTANQPTKESEWEEFEAFSSYIVHARETPTWRNSPAWQEEQTMYATKSQLTQREREVLCLLAAGHTDRKIAESLTISPRTVNRHMCNIFGKSEVPSRAAAAAYAVRNGLI